MTATLTETPLPTVADLHRTATDLHHIAAGKTFSKSVSNTERFGRVTTRTIMLGDYQVNAELMHGHSPNYSVYTHKMSPDGRSLCGPSFRQHGSVPGGRGVEERILHLAITAIAAGRAEHDIATCGICNK